jgi:hypothetical protein
VLSAYLARHPGVSVDIEERLSDERHGRPRRQRVARRHHQDEAVAAERVGLEAAGLDRIRVLSNTNALTEFLPEVLSAYLARHPGVSVDIEERARRCRGSGGRGPAACARRGSA